jgi:translation initiation factor IF-3
VNEKIRAREVRLIGPDGTQLGILSLNEALRKAQEMQLDLVEVSSASHPPVCRLMNYGKFKYEQAKKAKDSRKKQSGDVKEIKITRAHIAEHDLQVKVNHLIRFLEHGDKARLIVEFRGREQLYLNKGFEILNKLAERLSSISTVERKPTLEGRRIIMVLSPKRAKGEQSGKDKVENLQNSSQEV